MAASNVPTAETDVNCKDMALRLANEYTPYSSIDTTSQIKSFEDSLEENLTHLEEFCTVMDSIRSDNTLCIDELLPVIIKKNKEMEEMYKDIDKLEDFVKVVKTSVLAMEEEVEKAEQLFLQKNKVKQFLTSIWSNKNKKDIRRPKYQEPHIFITKDYIEVD